MDPENEMKDMVATLTSELGFEPASKEDESSASKESASADAEDGARTASPSADGPADVAHRDSSPTDAQPAAPAKPDAPTATSSSDTAVNPSDPAAPAEAKDAPRAAPSTWRKEAKELWPKLDPRVQEEIVKRESDILRGLGEQKQAVQVGQGFEKTIAPYMPLLQQHNLNPFVLTRSYMEMHRALALGTPKEKADVVRALIRNFSISPEGLLADSPAPAHVPPEVAALQEQLKALQSTVTRTTEAQAATERTRYESEVSSFAADPKHPYFHEVAEDIAGLIRKGACATLQEAYDTAVARNPVVRQKAIDDLLKQQRDADAKAAQERAAAARKATAANVQSSSKPKGSTAPKGSMDETLRAAADKLYSDASN